MNIQVYDMSVSTNSIIVFAGDMSESETRKLQRAARSIRDIYRNPVVFIPSGATIDSIGRSNVIELLMDAMSDTDLETLRDLVNAALETERGSKN